MDDQPQGAVSLPLSAHLAATYDLLKSRGGRLTAQETGYPLSDIYLTRISQSAENASSSTIPRAPEPTS